MPPKQKLSSSQKKRKNVGRRAKAANVKRQALESAARNAVAERGVGGAHFDIISRVVGAVLLAACRVQ